MYGRCMFALNNRYRDVATSHPKDARLFGCVSVASHTYNPEWQCHAPLTATKWKRFAKSRCYSHVTAQKHPVAARAGYATGPANSQWTVTETVGCAFPGAITVKRGDYRTVKNAGEPNPNAQIQPANFEGTTDASARCSSPDSLTVSVC